MSKNQIEHEVVISATVNDVWVLVAQPGFWVADPATLPGTVAIQGESIVVKNPDFGDFSVRVEEVRPPTYLAYRWASAFPGQPLTDSEPFSSCLMRGSEICCSAG